MGVRNIQYGQEHERLERILRSVDRPGDHCVGGRIFAPMPQVVVEGAGELSFPVTGEQIRALVAAAEQAPYGKGAETLVDTSVRDCRQIDASRVRVSGRAWPDSFARVMGIVADGLGLPAERLTAELYKLLVYLPGGFFAEHRDTEKAPGMVATLSLSLPVRGAGGELVVRHGGRERVVDLGAEEPSELAFAAFYADCLHEVRPLAEGHRVTLIYSLLLDGPGDAPGAPDHSHLTGPLAECLVRWRASGAADKLVWLLEHEYSEGGLSFGALKNRDDAVARLLGDAADRAGCELHAAVLRIDECGTPEYLPRHSDHWDDDLCVEMYEVHDRWEALDGWTARDGSRPPFGTIPLEPMELLPRGALDDAEPDDSRLEESMGNEGPTLEFFYRLAALVVWPSDRTIDVVARGGIDNAVSWVETQRRAADRGGGGRIAGLLARLTEVWPVGEHRGRPQDRSAMLRLLRRAGEADVAVDFLQRVVMRNYGGAENEALAAVLQVVGPAEGAEFLLSFVEEHLPRRFGDVVDVLAGTAGECAGDAAWRTALRGAAAAVFAGLDAAFRTEARIRRDGPRADDGWPPGRARAAPGDRASHMDWIGDGAVSGLLTLAHRLGLDDEASAAAASIADHPSIVTPDRMLPAALETLRRDGVPMRSAAYGALWRSAVDFLLERSSERPAEPADWTIAAAVHCSCDLCDRLRAFCRDPVSRVERFKVRKDLRRHLHNVIDRHGLDMNHVTTRRGRPYTLVCTKTRASHRRRIIEYNDDIDRMRALLEAAPEREGRDGAAAKAGGAAKTTRAALLEEALARFGDAW